MAITATTLSAALSSTARRLTVQASTNFTVGGFLSVNGEYMKIMGLSGTTIVDVFRGYFGTKAMNHGDSSTVQYGLATDFASRGIWYDEDRFAPVVPLYLTFPSTDTTGAAVTFTPAQLLSGLILRDPAGASRADLVPLATSLIAALTAPQIGTSFEVTIRNTADAAETITVTTNTGATLSGTMTIAQNNSKRFLVRITGVIPGSEAYTVYSLGTIVT